MRAPSREWAASLEGGDFVTIVEVDEDNLRWPVRKVVQASPRFVYVRTALGYLTRFSRASLLSSETWFLKKGYYCLSQPTHTEIGAYNEDRFLDEGFVKAFANDDDDLGYILCFC